jgi:hypothetical protein
MGVPLWLLRLLPMWDYICPRCEHEVPKNSHECPHCHERYPMPLKIPPKIYRNRKALEDYVHTHVFPKVSPAHREYLAQFFTELFNDGFESDFSAWDTIGGTPTVQGTIVHHGSNAMLSDGSNGEYCGLTGESTGAVRYIRWYIYADTVLTANNTQMDIGSFWSGASNIRIRLRKDAGGSLVWQIQGSSGTVDFGSWTEGTWYCVEYGHSNGNFDRVWIDGSLEWDDAGGVFDGFEQYYFGGWNKPNAVNVYVDCVVVSDAYIGPETEETLIEVADELGLSDAILRHKILSVTDSVGIEDAALGNKTPLVVNDVVSLAALVEAIAGAIIKTVFDTVGIADVVLMGKQVVAADTISVLDTVSTPSRVLQALEAVGVADAALVHKTLMITETVNLAEIVEVGVGGVKKTRLFLILGDLAVQLTGD